MAKEASCAESALSDNISAGGICIISSRVIALNTIITLEFRLVDISDTFHVPGRFVWSKKVCVQPGPESYYALGIEFKGMPYSFHKILARYVANHLRVLGALRINF